ncbi:unnamed protein product [Nezara viridula]|uniref:Uncharacterized protein n=1 Tax=Nezara viridula TaxID=85310 RepID=A0A9P0H3K6_NEZVI|nr:unnamed protein product [Nezara viridula]
MKGTNYKSHLPPACTKVPVPLPNLIRLPLTQWNRTVQKYRPNGAEYFPSLRDLDPAAPRYNTVHCSLGHSHVLALPHLGRCCNCLSPEGVLQYEERRISSDSCQGCVFPLRLNFEDGGELRRLPESSS